MTNTETINPASRAVEVAWLAGLRNFKATFPTLADRNGLIRIAEQEFFRSANPKCNDPRFPAEAPDFAYFKLLMVFKSLCHS